MPLTVPWGVRLEPARVALEQELRRTRVEDLDCIEDLVNKGNGATRQVVVFEANHDLREVVREIVEKTSQAD
jgi:hypothetical protein